MTLCLQQFRPPPTWRLKPFWLTHLPEEGDLNMQWSRYFYNNDNFASPLAVWESFKIHVRATLISHINKLKSTSEVAFEQALSALCSTVRQYAADPSPAHAAALKLQTRLVD